MSTDFLNVQTIASKPSTVQKSIATKASNDQFAKIFADNEAYGAKKADSPLKSESVRQTEHRHSVNAHKTQNAHEPQEPIKVKYSSLHDAPKDTSINDASQPSITSKPTQNKNDSADSTQAKSAKKADDTTATDVKTPDLSAAPLPQTELPQSVTVLNPVIHDVQNILAATTLANATSNILTSSPQTLSPLDTGALSSISSELISKTPTDLKFTDLKSIALQTQANTLLSAFADPSLAAKNRYSNDSNPLDSLFDELSQFSGKSDANTDDILIANFKLAVDAIKTANPTDTQFQKAGIIGALSGGENKTVISKAADILKTNLNADLVLAQPFGALLNNTLSQVNKGANKSAISATDISATLGSLPVAIASRALKGAREFTIHLHPAELGKVEVKMEVNDKGEIKAKLSVERVETLQMLQRDSSSLQRSLEQAGFKTSSDSLQFSLSQDHGSKHQHAQMNWSHNHNPQQKADYMDESNTVDVTAAVMNAYARRNNSALDIRI
jgi:Flagellar hook-length control protein FliK